MATKASQGKTNGASVSDVSNQIEILREDLSALTQTIADLSRAKGDEAITAARDKMADARDKATDQAQAARQQAAELQGQANDFIRNQPATALGIAAGLGFLVGFMGSRR